MSHRRHPRNILIYRRIMAILRQKEFEGISLMHAEHERIARMLYAIVLHNSLARELKIRKIVFNSVVRAFERLPAIPRHGEESLVCRRKDDAELLLQSIYRPFVARLAGNSYFA